MDGIHDLGGKQGFGPIEVDDGEKPFHADWEGREWGISQCARAPGITIDWWRHCRELIMPVDYLARPYFDSWAQNDLATYIEAGWFTLEEVRAGKSLHDNVEPGEAAPAMTLAEVLQADRDNTRYFDGEIDAPPAFAPGQRVRTLKHGARASRRTRLSRSVRSRNRGVSPPLQRRLRSGGPVARSVR